MHDDQREKEVQLLASKVLEASPQFFDNPNGPCEWTCPFCYAQETGGSGAFDAGVGMEDIQHDLDCAYLIAKGLSTK